ncbi:MAG TPA: exodeoxyribonuclease VII small subunit [Bacillota bacterium]|nr:exodeoxyribonuclease VII small subunit [Bacillota bacterium]
MAEPEAAPRLEVSYEDAVSELEAIVARLEHGDLSLDESLKLFERGIGLMRAASIRLDEAERRVDQLTLDEAGRPVLRPMAGLQPEEDRP